MLKFTLKKGKESDKEWLYSLYCKTMRTCIEKTWGWDEKFQYEGFSNNLSPEHFEIVVLHGKSIGGFCLKEKIDHLWLEMILIDPLYQGKGLGKALLQSIIRTSLSKGIPLKLSVIKANPVKQFYEKLGFEQYDENDSFYMLRHRT